VIALKAVLLCESIRVEMDGTLTLVGMYNERLIAPAGEGPIKVTSLAVLVVVCGLRGELGLAIRHAIRAAEDGMDRGALADHAHDPGSDEHNFIFAHPDVTFARPGLHALDVQVIVGSTKLEVTHTFSVERAF